MSIRDVLKEAIIKLRQVERELSESNNAKPYDPTVVALNLERADFHRRKVADLAEKLVNLT